jgi:hypothetical protein
VQDRQGRALRCGAAQGQSEGMTGEGISGGETRAADTWALLLCFYVRSVKITSLCLQAVALSHVLPRRRSSVSSETSDKIGTNIAKKKKFHLFQASFSSTNIAKHLSSMKLVHRHRRVVLSIFIFL